MASTTGSSPDGGQFDNDRRPTPQIPTDPTVDYYNEVDQGNPRPSPSYPQQFPPVYPSYPQAYPQAYPSGSFVSYHVPNNYQQQQQPQQGVIIVQQQPAYVTTSQTRDNYCCHITFSCLVFWFCGCLFGGIAFILAMVASNSNQRKESKCLGTASLIVSGVGLAIGLALWGVIIWLIVKSLTNTSCFNYSCGGSCYNFKSYYTSYECDYRFHSSCYSNGYCYYNY